MNTEPDRTAGKPDASERRQHRWDVAAVVVLSVATVGSAWCTYQAERWNGVLPTTMVPGGATPMISLGR